MLSHRIWSCALVGGVFWGGMALGQQERLQVPPDLPGAGAPAIKLPPLDPNNPGPRDEALKKLYPPLPDLGPEVLPASAEKPLSLGDLEQFAQAQNPVVRQALAEVQAAEGQAIQAGLYPNPNIGYQGDQMNALGTSGQQGGYVEQIIKTCGKLKLARSAALMDVHNAQLALRRTQVDLLSRVRAAYFAVLVAQENLRVARAMSRLTEEAYRIQVAQVKAGQAAAYEPLQLYVLAVQARATMTQARNRYLGAWKQLAAELGQPALPPTALAGRADTAVPVYPFDPARDLMLRSHTEVGTAYNNILRARYQLRLAEVTPYSDISTHVYLQRDNTTQPGYVQVGVQAGFALPIYDRNQGNIQSARANLARAEQDVGRVENSLSSRLAEAYERYANNRTLVSYYRDQILPSQVQVYRAIQQRYQQEPDKVSYNDIVVAQQTLATSLTQYLQSLAAQWTSVVEVANLLQLDDLYVLGKQPCGADSCLDSLAEPETWPLPATGLPPVVEEKR